MTRRVGSSVVHAHPRCRLLAEHALALVAPAWRCRARRGAGVL